MTSPQGLPVVAHVVLSLKAGGLERLVCNLAAAAPLAGFRIRVYCLDEIGELAPDLERAGGSVALVQRGPGFDLRTVRRLAARFRSDGVRVVHTHSLDPMLYAGLAAGLAGVPIRLHTQHSPLVREYGLVDRTKFRVAARFYQRIIGVSADITRALAGFVPLAKQMTILNGIDANRFERRTTPAALVADRKDQVVIGTVARLSQEKGVDVLVEALLEVRASMPSARLAIAGDGPERPALEARVRSAGLQDAVSFLGFQAAIHEVLPGFDLFVLPSRSEGIPLALLEAMAAGLPIIATAVGGVPEVVTPGETGSLVPPGDPHAMASAMLDLLRRPDERARLAAGAQRHVADRLSVNAMASAYRRLYLGDRPESGARRLAKWALQRLPRGLIFWAGPRDARRIALTFDDGPDPDTTLELLGTLRRYKARATFFLVGEKVAAFPDLVRRILGDGHEIGSHSYTHPDFDRLSWARALEELTLTRAALERHQSRCTLFRPPKGKLCLQSLLGAWRTGQTVVMWSVDLKDFRAESATEIAAALAERPPQNGDIVLYHGTSAASLAALPAVLEAALRCDRTPVTVSELLRRR